VGRVFSQESGVNPARFPFPIPARRSQSLAPRLPTPDTLLTMRPPFGSPTLLLIPTALEMNRLEDQGGFGQGLCLCNLCGFGPVAAAARCAQLLAEIRPARVILTGIAGAYDIERHPVESALEFGEVAIDGVGAGQGSAFEGPPALGFPQWPGSPGTTPHPVVDSLPLAAGGEAGGARLLTTCSASADEGEARQRLERHPQAVAEDMEGFAVGLACSLFGTPLRIVRGISNRVGDRQPENWRIPGALAAARELVLRILTGEEGDTERGAPLG
jgi:futalosine hydrolase